VTSRQTAPVGVDYDSDLDRFLTNQDVTRRFSNAGDVHAPVAARLALEHPAGLVLDLGGGNGLLARHLLAAGVRVVVVDQAKYVAGSGGIAVQAQAERLPFANGTFDAVAALWMLYHLPDPLIALSEAARVLAPGGTFVACTSSRTNDPEFADVLPRWGSPSTFDAEDAGSIVENVFTVVEEQHWDAPLVSLPDEDAVTAFLRGRGLSAIAAASQASKLNPPLKVTKRGCVIWGKLVPKA